MSAWSSDVCSSDLAAARDAQGREGARARRDRGGRGRAHRRRITDILVSDMKAAGWGRIVTLTGAMTQPGVNAAGPAKAALWSWSRSLSAQLAPHGITVNCIAPGRVKTPQIVGRDRKGVV